MKKILIFVAALLFAADYANAGLSIRNPYNDGMVLEQNSSAAFKGFAEPGAKVTVVPSWNGRKYKTVADADGLWGVSLDTPAGGYTAYSIKVTSGKESYTVKDVLIGEVWFSSGQSNMAMPIAGWGVVDNAYEYICGPAAANRVRVFMGELCQSHTPRAYTEGWWFKGTADGIPAMSAVSYFFARKLNEVLDIPVGVVCEAYGGTRVEAWMPYELLSTFEEIPSREAVDAMHDMSRPYMNYNAMIYPCIGYTVKGFLWYQGCSNEGGNPEEYTRKLTSMVDFWRNAWGDKDCQLPFYLVELAPYQYSYEWEIGRAAEFRNWQLKSTKIIPNSAIVGTNDTVPEEARNDIHPTNKKTVGDRLALLALNRQYGFTNLYCYAPVASEITFDFEHQVKIKIENGDGALSNINNICGMDVAGEDGVFYPVKMASYDSDSGILSVWCDEVAFPHTVRYAWGDYVPGNVKSRFGQPLMPFCLGVKY